MVISHTWAIHAMTCQNVRYEKGQLTTCHTACPSQESFQGQSRVPSELRGLFEKESYWLESLMWAVCVLIVFILIALFCACIGVLDVEDVHWDLVRVLSCACPQKYNDWCIHVSVTCWLMLIRGGVNSSSFNNPLFWPEGTSHLLSTTAEILY